MGSGISPRTGEVARITGHRLGTGRFDKRSKEDLDASGIAKDQSGTSVENRIDVFKP